MALIKYTGKENVTLTLNGERMLIKPNKVFSAPQHLSNQDNFSLLGLSQNEKNGIDEKGVPDSANNLKLELKSYYTPYVDFDYLDESGYPMVSICIVTKDGWGVIDRCIESIEEHNKYAKIEVLICDTGTTDEKVLEYYKTLDKEKYTIFYDNKYNFSKNNNFLVEQSKGDVVLFMNNDVFLTYDAVSEMVKYVLCSNMGCIGHRMVWDKDRISIQHDGQLVYDQYNGNWIGPGHHHYRLNIKNVSNENARVEGVTAAFLMMRKSLFNKVNGFDEEYKDVFQDVDLNLKVGKLGYDNFCIREKTLIHVDHSTRKEDVTKDSQADLHKIARDWFHKGPFPVKIKPRYSVLVCATKKEQLKTLFESIKTRDEYEFIYVNNKSNYFWASEALNQLTKASVGDILFHMHQDVTFDAYEPFSYVHGIANQLGNFGIVGPAGIQTGAKGSIRGVDFSSMKYNFDYMRCQTLDEFCLISQRRNGLEFGEYLDHFHFYGADICLQSTMKGLTNYVIKIPITHHSGGEENLKNGDGYFHFRSQGKKLYQRWKKDFPSISTTTTHFRPHGIWFFLGSVLGLSPGKEEVEENFSIEENVKAIYK